MKTNGFSLHRRIKIKAFYFAGYTIFSCLIIGFICVNVNLGQIPERFGRNGERKIGRINYKQSMLERFQRENLNKSSGTAQASAVNSGDLDLSFNPMVVADNAAVEAVVPMPDGKTLVGGSFNSYNGTARNNGHLQKLERLYLIHKKLNQMCELELFLQTLLEV